MFISEPHGHAPQPAFSAEDGSDPEKGEGDSVRKDNGAESIAETSVTEQDQEYMDERVVELIRTSTEILSGVNPFLDMHHPSMDPNSPQFDIRRWSKALFHTFSSDPSRYPQRSAGVSYRNVSVYGNHTSANYQKDVGNVLLGLPNLLLQPVTQRKRKVQILRSFDGLVKSGEMLVVLGRPGR